MNGTSRPRKKPTGAERPTGYSETLKLPRRTIRRGERVRVRSNPGKRDGFHGIFSHVYTDKGGQVAVVFEVESRSDKYQRVRHVKPERLIRRRHQEVSRCA